MGVLVNPQLLLAALRAHLAGGGAPGGPPGAPPDAGPPPGLGGGLAGPGPSPGPGGGSGGDFESIVQRMIALGRQAEQAAPDAVDASGMAKVVAQLHQFAASAQQDRDQAMGTSPAVRSMRRSTAAAGAAGPQG